MDRLPFTLGPPEEWEARFWSHDWYWADRHPYCLDCSLTLTAWHHGLNADPDGQRCTQPNTQAFRPWPNHRGA